jgi:hypothetical protein
VLIACIGASTEEYELEGLKNSSVRYGAINLKTFIFVGVVAALSRYIMLITSN